MKLGEAKDEFDKEFLRKFGIHGVGEGSGQINVYVSGHYEQRARIPDVFGGWPTNIIEIEPIVIE